MSSKRRLTPACFWSLNLLQPEPLPESIMVTQSEPSLLGRVVSPAGLGCAAPVAVDGSQAAAQIVAEGAELNQSQVGRHLGLVLTLETRSYVHSWSFRGVHVQAKRLLHLPPVREDSDQPITAKRLCVYVCATNTHFTQREDLLSGPLSLRRVLEGFSWDANLVLLQKSSFMYFLQSNKRKGVMSESLHKDRSRRMCVCRPEHVCVTLVMCVTRSLSVTSRSISPSRFEDKAASSFWNMWQPANIRLTHMSCRGRHQHI